MSYCKFCGQEIDWITSAEGKHVPVDPDPVFVIEDDGPDTFLDDMGAIITGRQARPEEERRDLPVAFVPHRRTCPPGGQARPISHGKGWRIWRTFSRYLIKNTT